MSQPPLVQQPTTPQYNKMPQQLYPQLPNVSDIPSTIPSNTAASQQNRRPQVARNLQYKDNSFDAVARQEPILPQQSGFTIDSFRLLSVLGRGHFGKVILSQYKKTGKLLHHPHIHICTQRTHTQTSPFSIAIIRKCIQKTNSSAFCVFKHYFLNDQFD